MRGRNRFFCLRFCLINCTVLIHQTIGLSIWVPWEATTAGMAMNYFGHVVG
jgi:hypothetical protein